MHGKLLILAIAGTLFLTSSNIAAQELPTASPQAVGMSADRLTQVGRLMQQSIRDSLIAGAVTLIARNGQVVHYEAWGMRDIETDSPMKRNAIFRIASMSKPITVTAAMILYEEGRFLLNDPVSRYIPEFAHSRVMIAPDEPPFETVPTNREITIRDLMNHTSGITYNHPLYEEAGIDLGRNTRTVGEMVRTLATLPLMHQPGEAFTYGLNNDVLGYLVEVVSGISFDKFLRQRIFEPLGMKDTAFFTPPSKHDRLATIYDIAQHGGLAAVSEQDLTHGGQLNGGTFFAGGSGLVSTASDYVRFAQMLLNGGELDGVRILSPHTVELMTTNSIGDLWSAFRANSGDKYGYGVGIRTERGEYDELESLGTFMWDGAYHTRFWADPEEHLIGIFMSQLRPRNWRLPGLFRNVAYQSIVK